MASTKKTAIVTCSDFNCGEFLVEHWLKSLRKTGDLEVVDVVVIDYGLNERQRKRLKDVVLYPSSAVGHPSIIGYWDILRFILDVRVSLS
jgi:hypothetical protein